MAICDTNTWTHFDAVVVNGVVSVSVCVDINSGTGIWRTFYCVCFK